MNFGKLKTALKGLINRKDLTDALAGDFVNRSIAECQRITRLAPNIRLLIADDWDGTNNAMAVPGNYVELCDIFTDDRVLEVADKARFFQTCTSGSPQVYTKAGPNWLVRPTPTPGTRVYVEYYADSEELLADDDVNLWTKANFDTVLYGAAALAADFFQMEDGYVKRFQGKSDTLMQAILAQDYDDRWSGTHTVGRPQAQDY